MHVCTKTNPMRVNSDPDDWQHPDAVEEPDTYTDTSDMAIAGIPVEYLGPTVTLRCPNCGEAVLSSVPPRGIIGGFNPEIRGKPLS